MMNNTVTIVGAGLAGCEAAWQLVRRGVPVRLIDMKPKKYSPAHKSEGFAELVCSNSLKAEHLTNASGLLKAEMKALDGLILRCAEESRVPAGGALAVDRHIFSDMITRTLKEFQVLELLIEHPGNVLSREHLLSTVWGYEFDGASRTIDVHIRTLRQKLEEAGSLIETVRGVGYRMVVPGHQEGTL